MASKNLGAVIQRAISDGAFRRQLQSDPAAALRGFNLTPDEIAAVRSGDSSRLMSLGVDQRMSKAFTVGGSAAQGATRNAMSVDGSRGAVNGVADDHNAGAREGIPGDPTSGTRAINDPDNTAGARGTVSTGSDMSGTRAVHNTEPSDGTRAASSTGGDVSGTRAVQNTEPSDGTRADVSDPTVAGTRAMHDDAPFGGTGSDVTGGGTAGSSAMEDPNSPEFAARVDDSTVSGTRAMHDSDPFDSGTSASATTGGTEGPSGNAISADDNFSVASRMADANLGDATRGIHDSDPFNSGTGAAATGDDVLSGGDTRIDPGFTDGGTHSAFVPNDSADVQHELSEGDVQGGTGDALGNTETGDSHSWS